MAASINSWLWLFLITQGVFSMKLYEYYLPDGVVSSGLVAEGEVFKLNGKDLRILSGAFHYFRVHPHYWRDTFRKIRAAGLNTVETYVPWNLHEPRKGVYDFGDLGEDMSFLLDVRAFIKMAKEEDLFVIFRPGPYICSEWDFGGLPSWLLRDYTMQVRSYYNNFRSAAGEFFNALMPQVADLQFMRGGPIIMVQVENEFGAFGYDDFPRDKLYLEFLKENLIANGMGDSLLFTSDGVLGSQDLGSLPGVFMAANFQNKVEENLSMLKSLQPNRPAMVAEFWTGWYDNWLLDHHRGWDHSEFAANLESILQHNVSVNLYMFIGGTNWGFMAGADGVEDLPGSTSTIPQYAPDTSSYDYDAPLSEAGDYTIKYNTTRDVLEKYNPLAGIVSNPDAPDIRGKTAYPSVPIKKAMNFSSIINNIKEQFKSSSGLVSMENLPCNDGNGQSYGYLAYCTKLPIKAGNYTLKIKGHIRDMAQVIVDGTVITQPYNKDGDGEKAAGFWGARDAEFLLPESTNETQGDLIIVVENLGRVNYGQPHNFKQSKGLVEGPVILDGASINSWTMVPLEFKKSFINSLKDWNSYAGSLSTPGLYRATLDVPAEPMDTFVDMSAWNKGVLFINGFNLGRYWSEGPQKTLYLPAPFLNQGENEIMVYEQYEAADEIIFTDYPIFL